MKLFLPEGEFCWQSASRYLSAVGFFETHSCLLTSTMNVMQEIIVKRHVQFKNYTFIHVDSQLFEFLDKGSLK